MIYLPDDIWKIIKSFFIENINKKKYNKFIAEYKKNIYFSCLTKKPCLYSYIFKNKVCSIFELNNFMYESWCLTNQIRFFKYCIKHNLNRIEIENLLRII